MGRPAPLGKVWTMGARPRFEMLAAMAIHRWYGIPGLLRRGLAMTVEIRHCEAAEGRRGTPCEVSNGLSPA
jgi:hypothetical protein